MDSKKNDRQKKHVMIRIAICALILVVGWLGMNGLAGLKKPPAEAISEEQAIKVQTMAARPQDYPVVITGYGEVKALTVVDIAPEVTGRVVYTHSALNAGEIIPAGDIMFRIDTADYESGLQEATAGVAQWRNTVARLKKQFAIDTQRLKTLERNAQLAETEFERVKRLFKTDRVGTQSGVDQAERTYNSASDQADQMAQAVTLYPLQIREAESNLTSAKARLSLAETKLSRCTVKAPFDARIKFVAVEAGEFVSPGQNILTLADDTLLEIQVPLDSQDARSWLQFETPAGNRRAMAWFANLKPVTCTIRWTEDKTGAVWTGSLNRVVKFDQQTRTLTVAVRVTAESAIHGGEGALPLVEGMFCTIQIPGHTMRGVYRLPRQAVSYENKVYLATTENRLRTVTVTVARIEGESTFVDGGLNPGDTVILTRLINPLENALLDFADRFAEKDPTS
jgi:RND family efflux transporter MFP subunit